jgi:uncharacterized protein (UPF0332 family)
MTEEQERLQSARRRLEASRILLNHAYEPDAMSRPYFAVSESARALLLLRDLTPKTHEGIGMKLGQHFRELIDVGVLTKLRQNRRRRTTTCGSRPRAKSKRISSERRNL